MEHKRELERRPALEEGAEGRVAALHPLRFWEAPGEVTRVKLETRDCTSRSRSFCMAAAGLSSTSALVHAAPLTVEF